MKKISVGILGATGAVGQRFVQLLEDHPWFSVTALAASEKSQGKKYKDAVTWKMDTDIPEAMKQMEVSSCDEKLPCDLLFSGLDSNVAGEIEENFAKKGYAVLSNSKNHRMDTDVPLVIPEVNPDHLESIQLQQKRFGGKGFIVTNPNCIVVPLALALKPIQDAFGIEKIAVFTMQAISGAGYPGVPSLDILDNVVPLIREEEPKVESEPQKILGEWNGKEFVPASITISAQCNRVLVRDGHTLNVSFSTKKKTSVEEIKKVLKNFEGEPQKLKLPFAPTPAILVTEDEFRPQPYFDRNRGRGMTISVGRVRECNLLDFKMVILGHNTIRGAAGAAILNAELLYKKGLIGS